MKIFVLAIALGALPAFALAETAPAPAAPVAATTAPANAAPPSAGTEQGGDTTRGKYRMACAADFAKFCADVEKGRGKKRACLESHQSEITSGCKDALAERAAAMSKS